MLRQKGKRRGESARIGWCGRYSGRMEIGEGAEGEEVGWGGVGWGGDVEGKKSLSQQKFSLKF